MFFRNGKISTTGNQDNMAKKSEPGDVRFDKQRELIMSARSGNYWHVCPCCVGKIPGTLFIMPAWSYVKNDLDLYVNLLAGSTVNVGKVN